MGQWPEAKEKAVEAEAINRSVGSRAFLSDSLALLCRADAAVGSWHRALLSGAEAKALADEVRNLEQIIICRLALSEAHLCMQRWYAEEAQGQRPPVLLDEAIRKATEHANRAKTLAQSKGMKGYVTKANQLLAQINSSLT